MSIELPLETVLRRAQISASLRQGAKYIVDVPEKFHGIAATMWDVTRNEKATEEDSRAQGIKGLYRGWRLSAWLIALCFVMGIMLGYIPSYNHEL
jgi:hypothetical protein